MELFLAYRDRVVKVFSLGNTRHCNMSLSLITAGIVFVLWIMH